MLGKGLESLIPPHQNKFGTGQASDQNPVTQQAGNGAGKNGAQLPQNNPATQNTDGASDNFVAEPQANTPVYSETPMQQPQPTQTQPVQPKKPLNSQPEPIQHSFNQPQPLQQKKSRSPETIGSVFHIEIEKIKPNPQQPRRQFNEDGLKDLASSIREFGILQPIVVSKIEIETPEGAAVEYQLIAGERRWLAS